MWVTFMDSPLCPGHVVVTSCFFQFCIWDMENWGCAEPCSTRSYWRAGFFSLLEAPVVCWR